MTAKRLRPVAAGETAPPKPPKTVVEAAEAGSERDLLVAMRRVLAAAVDDPNTAKRDLASLTKRLRETVNDIKAIDAREAQEGGERGPTADEAWSAV